MEPFLKILDMPEIALFPVIKKARMKQYEMR